MNDPPCRAPWEELPGQEDMVQRKKEETKKLAERCGAAGREEEFSGVGRARFSKHDWSSLESGGPLTQGKVGPKRSSDH